MSTTKQADDATHVEVSENEIYAAMQMVLAWRLHHQCGGDPAYLTWIEKTFPSMGEGLRKLPATVENAIARQVPLEQFDLLIEGIVNAHRQCHMIWRRHLAGEDIGFAELLPIPGSKFIQ